jgi:aryl-alcohol dehydrogenase-like predicted oxidoreductase
MASSQKPNVNVVFGLWQLVNLVRFEPPFNVKSRAHPAFQELSKHEYTSTILDTFQKHGHNEIDTAHYYGQGSSEEYLGQLHWQKRGHQVLPNRGMKYAC